MQYGNEKPTESAEVISTNRNIDFSGFVTVRIISVALCVAIGYMIFIIIPNMIFVLLIPLILIRYIYIIFKPKNDFQFTRTESTNPETFIQQPTVDMHRGFIPKLKKILIAIDKVAYDLVIWNKNGVKRTVKQKVGSWTVNILVTVFIIIGLLFVLIIVATILDPQ